MAAATGATVTGSNFWRMAFISARRILKDDISDFFKGLPDN